MLDLSWEGVQVNRVTVGKLSQISQFVSSYIRVFHWSKFWSSITEQKMDWLLEISKVIGLFAKYNEIRSFGIDSTLGNWAGFLVQL